MNISSLLSPDAPRGRIIPHRTDEHTGPELYSSTPSDVPIQAPSPIHPLNQAALWENGGYDVESVEKAMSKSSSSSAPMAGFYDPIHDHEPSPITLPTLTSGGGVGLTVGTMGGAYDPVHNSGIGSGTNQSHTMEAPTHHFSPITADQEYSTIASLAPPPIPHSRSIESRAHAPQTSQHQHHYPHHDYYTATTTKKAYPDVLNNLTAHYSPSIYIERGQESTGLEKTGVHYDPVGEVVSHQQSADSMAEVPQTRRRKRVWEDESDVEDDAKHVTIPPQSSTTATTTSSVYQISVSATEEPNPGHEHEPQLKNTERDNSSEWVFEGSHSTTCADTARIKELRELLEQYPLYKPAYLEIISSLRRSCQSLETEEARLDLESMRIQAIETMQLGELGWLDWIQDEDKACKSIEERMKVIILCSKAVEEQPISVRLWKVYVTQLEDQYNNELAMDKQGDDTVLRVDEVIGNTFTKDMFFSVYAQAVEATKYHISESHILWDKYLELLSEDLESQFSEKKLQRTRDAFLNRLSTPHPNIDSTFSTYSTFITNYENANYENTMVATNKAFVQSKTKFEEREMYELQLARAIEAVDDDASVENANAEWYAWKEYFYWELGQPKKKQDVELVNALFERCIMRYDYKGQEMWEWYLDFMAEKASQSPRVLPVLERAVHAFPALPSVWCRYLVAMEARFKSAEEMERVKDKAIDTLSKVVGGEALLALCYTWAGVSKRRILQGSVGDDEKVLLVEEIQQFMKEFRDLDPEARLDRLYIALCSHLQPPDIDSARKVWRSFTTHNTRSKLAHLWLKYYQWEFQYGTKQAAGAILRHACSKAVMIDDPNAIFNAYSTYVVEWGDTPDVAEANWKLRRWKENVPQVTVVPAIAMEPVQSRTTLLTEKEPPAVTDIPSVTVSAEHMPVKRRRSIGQDDYPGSPPNKKSRAEYRAIRDDPNDDDFAPKRDRENTTVVVRNLPKEVSELRLRQFFRDCGKIHSLKILSEQERSMATATIEFESLQDVLSAQTKDMKSIDGHQIEVQIGAGLTLYVTNFPPVADEDYIRNLFKGFGKIADIRFPSLKYNTHRRFCYVQFLSTDSAHAALSLHGKKLGQKEKLLVKVSDPNQKQHRSGPVYEGREVFLRNIDFKATEVDIRELFEREVEGKVETVRLPNKVPGKHQGFGFVVFEKKKDAEKAIALDDKLKLGERNISIRLSESKMPGSGIGQVPLASSDVASQTDRRKDEVTTSPAVPPPMEVIKQKTLAILNLPDTVNDTRVREVFEKYGTLRKVQLRPEHGGAVVEFVDVRGAGKAELALAGYKFGRGQEGMRIGRVEDLLKQKAVVRTKEEVVEKKGKGKARKKDITSPSPLATFAVPRNVIRVGGVKEQRKKRGLGFLGALSRREVDGGAEGDAGGKERDCEDTPELQPPIPKSNADFKAMFLKK